jgi:hypothetical protein
MTPARCGRHDRHSLRSRRRSRRLLLRYPASGLPLVARARCIPTLRITQPALRCHPSPAKRNDPPNLAYNKTAARAATLAPVRRGARAIRGPSENVSVQMSMSP